MTLNALPEPEYVAKIRAELRLERCRVAPYWHQVVGIKRLIDHPYFFLTDEMGSGKTLQTICAAQLLYLSDVVDHVIVVAPASVRTVWADPDLGELAKHLWHGVPSTVTEFHARSKTWFWMDGQQKKAPSRSLHWTITNYDFIRNAHRLQSLITVCGKNTLLVLDESAAVKNHRALQTKACEALRKRCARIILLNGTPIANNPGDLYSQGHIMNPAILNCSTFFHFRSRYAILGGWMQKAIVGWRDLEDIQKRFAPYVLRRLKADCLDLPPKLPPTVLTAALTDHTWGIYKKMRDEMVAWLDTQTVAVAAQAGVKAMRLAQITSGFLGGVIDPGLEEESEDDLDDRPDWLRARLDHAAPGHALARALPPQEIGHEKLDVLIEWIGNQLEADPNIKLLLWCRFRPELARLVARIRETFPHVAVGEIHGGQKKNKTVDERGETLRLLDPRTMPPGPVIVCGTPASGSLGLNLAGAHTVVYVSNDYSLKTRLQADDRCHRVGQTSPVSYVDMIATGPTGQKTIDHAVLKALRNKEDIATFTVNAWKSILLDE